MGPDFLDKLFAEPELAGMGHHQRREDLNLGLGWLYYGLVRVVRPRRTICIGSWRGFVPIVMAKGNLDNLEMGTVDFIDPSLVDEQWRDGETTRAWFERFGAANVRHHQMTTQEFVGSDYYRGIEAVDLLFVDGMHTAEQARFDHQSFENLLSDQAIVLFHDSVRYRTSYMYGRENSYEHTVVDYMAELKQRGDLQVFDLPFDSGVTLVRANRLW